jgi:crotonobetainyl-CoA:carnitine CoA-transferase CaiB-like acyl-CoA transferase
MSADAPAAAPPLAGLRVLDLSRVLAGPYCTMLLADLGADVVKLERPDGGDTARAWGPPFVAGESTYFLSVNRGKRSVAVDLAREEGRRTLVRLARRADLVVENFLPTVAERLGVTHAALSEGRPELVLVSIRGYPAESPEADRPGFDAAIQGAAGLMHITGAPDGPPTKVGVAVTDLTAGMLAATAALAALVEARRTGRGRHVTVSLYDAQLAWLANRGAEALVAGEDPGRLGNDHPSICPYATFAAADGHVVVAVGTDGQFRRLCALLGTPRLADDPRFATNADRVRHRDALMPVLAERFADRRVDAWVAELRAGDIPGGPVRSVREVVADAPWATVTHHHPSVGALRSFRSPMAFDGRHHTAALAPPVLGADTDAVLRELDAPDVEDPGGDDAPGAAR